MRPAVINDFLRNVPRTDEVVAVPVEALPPDHRARLSLGVNHLRVQGRWLHAVWEDRGHG